MRRETTPEDEMRWALNDVLQDAHLDLTPYEDSAWEVLDKKNQRIWASDHVFVIYRKGEDSK